MGPMFRLTPALVLLFLGISVHVGHVLAAALSAGQSGGDKLRQEESVDYYRRWLERDVVYIISEEEKAVFDKLTTSDEKDAFIEQFWARRDTNPDTAENEFKLEHYRRIAYANEMFGSGIEGWVSDRGRAYIMFGAPKTIDRNPTGEKYLRTAAEGGGETMTYPYETWYYPYIEGIGSGISLEFVDPSFTGEYHLALHPYEKDALLNVPGQGLTFDEAMGTVSKRARIDALFMGRPSYDAGHTGADRAFQGLENLQRYFQLRSPKEVKYPDLRAVVRTEISYETAKLRPSFTYGYLYLDADHCLVPATFGLRLAELTPRPNPASQEIVKVNLYGKVTDLAHRVQYEFEESVTQAAAGDRDQLFLYEKRLPLKPGRYKLTGVLKDEFSGNIGVVERGLEIPPMPGEGLAASSLRVFIGARKTGADGDLTEPFTIPGGMKLYPSLDRTFQKGKGPLGLFMEIYNCAFAADTGVPSVGANLSLKDGAGKRVMFVQLPRSSLRLVGNRVMVLHQVDTGLLAPGKYTAELSAFDAIQDREIKQSVSFEVSAG
ncbi:MAG: GWxTD domain-containing protein [Acidobacteriota bacterium]